jgi:hypothetical protein
MRALSVSNIYEKKFKTYPFTSHWQKAMDNPETNGCWLVYGAEKNGKTWFSIKLAEYLSTFERVLYVSAEEGLGRGFVDACKRARVEVTSRRLNFLEYLPLEELDEKLSSKKSAKIVFLDNCTIYADELKGGVLRQLLLKHSDKLFVLVAHEEKGEPYTAAAKMAKKLAKIICRVEGLTAHISGRCSGGKIIIDEHKAALYWGMPEN